MVETTVIKAFLMGNAAQAPGLRSESGCLYSDESLIARWDGKRVQILPGKGDAKGRQCKDILTELVLCDMARHSLIQRIVNPNLQQEGAYA